MAGLMGVHIHIDLTHVKAVMADGEAIITKHKIFWKGYGPSYSYSTNPSFCTEPLALLALLRFIHHMIKFWNLTCSHNENIDNG